MTPLLKYALWNRSYCVLLYAVEGTTKQCLWMQVITKYKVCNIGVCFPNIITEQYHKDFLFFIVQLQSLWANSFHQTLTHRKTQFKVPSCQLDKVMGRLNNLQVYDVTSKQRVLCGSVFIEACVILVWMKRWGNILWCIIHFNGVDGTVWPRFVLVIKMFMFTFRQRSMHDLIGGMAKFTVYVLEFILSVCLTVFECPPVCLFVVVFAIL